MSGRVGEIHDRLAAEFPAAVSLRSNPGPSGQDSILIERSSLVEVAGFLRDSLGFDMLTNLSGVDWPDAALAGKVCVPAAADSDGEGEKPEVPGFLEVVYHIESVKDRGGIVTLRCRTGNRGDDNSVPSLVSIWRSAEFQEREAYDLYGIVFTGHPDLRRILMWDEFTDHPMRKDYVAPDDYEYEPTPHDEVLEKAKKHYHADGSAPMPAD